MKEFTIKPWVKILAWLSAAIIVYLNVQLVIQEIQGWIKDAGGNAVLVYSIVVPLALGCLGLLLYIFVHPFLSRGLKERKQLPHGNAELITTGMDIHYRHIGIALDFSGNDQRIIQNALMVGGKEAKYTFIHIVESAAARYFGKNALDHETNLDKNSLAEYTQRIEELGYLSEGRIGYGKPAIEIARVVLQQDIDLLVMGAHGHKGFKDLIFGTTVDAVRHRIKIPVLVIK